MLEIIVLLRQLTEQTHGKNAVKLDHTVLSKFVQKDVNQFWANRTFLTGRPEIKVSTADDWVTDDWAAEDWAAKDWSAPATVDNNSAVPAIDDW